jgi:hypothetical protein
VLRFEGRRLSKSKLKRPTALVVDDDSPVLQDCLRRWQNANPWIRFGRLSVSQVYPSRFRSARNFCSLQIGSTIALRVGNTAGNLHLRGQTLLFRIKHLVPFVDPVER